MAILRKRHVLLLVRVNADVRPPENIDKPERLPHVQASGAERFRAPIEEATARALAFPMAGLSYLAKTRRVFVKGYLPGLQAGSDGRGRFRGRSRVQAPGVLDVSRTLTLLKTFEFHLDGMCQDGTPIPPPSSHDEYVEVAARSSKPALP